MTSQVPVTVVTGFLGAGKTTLLSNLLKETHGRATAVLVNEFGEISIDGVIFKGCEHFGEVEIHELTGNLIAYGGDEQFYAAMRALAARRNRIDHILIETSGLALPTAVMEALEGSELSRDFVLDATLAVVDTPLLLAGEFDRDRVGSAQPNVEPVTAIFERQLEYADVVVLNKIDGLNEDTLLEAGNRVRKRASDVRFIELAFGARLDVQLTLGLHLHKSMANSHHHHGSWEALASARGTVPPADQTQLDGHLHSGLSRHLHGLLTHQHVHEHDPGWLSFMLQSAEPQEVKALTGALSRAAEEEPLLRAKGFACIRGEERRLVVQAVRSRVNNSWEEVPDGDHGSEIVFIGYHLSRERVTALLKRFTGTKWR